MKKKKAAESEEVIKRPKTENKILVKKEAGLAEQFPVKVSAKVDGLDLVSGAIMPMRV